MSKVLHENDSPDILLIYHIYIRFLQEVSNRWSKQLISSLPKQSWWWMRLVQVQNFSLCCFFGLNLGRFPKVRTGQADYGQTSHFDNDTGFFQELLLKNHLFPAYYLGFDWSSRIVLTEWSGRLVLTNGKHPEISCLWTVIAIPGLEKNLNSSLPFG